MSVQDISHRILRSAVDWPRNCSSYADYSLSQFTSHKIPMRLQASTSISKTTTKMTDPTSSCSWMVAPLPLGALKTSTNTIPSQLLATGRASRPVEQPLAQLMAPSQPCPSMRMETLLKKNSSSTQIRRNSRQLLPLAAPMSREPSSALSLAMVSPSRCRATITPSISKTRSTTQTRTTTTEPSLS